MRRLPVALVASFVLFACQPAPKPSPEAAAADASPANSAPSSGPEASASLEPGSAAGTEPGPELVAGDLPAVVTLEARDVVERGAGRFEFLDATDELAPRAALQVRDGLLLVGQAYEGRRPGTPPKTWRWAGFVPNSGDPRSTLLDPGAIRAATAHASGGLVIGTSGTGFDTRGWLAKVGPDGIIQMEAGLESPNTTELFDLIPGRNTDEAVIVAGYVDAQGWLVSLDPTMGRRWEKYIGSYGYTQVSSLAWLDNGDLLLVGSRAKAFGEFWAGVAPGDGGESAAPDDVVQTKIEIAGSDPNQALRMLVDLGPEGPGYVAIGTAKRNHVQDHDQLVAAAFDRTGVATWSRVIDGVRVITVWGARVDGAGVSVLVEVPTTAGAGEPGVQASALALVQVPASVDGPVQATRLAGTEGWTSAGWVEGSDQPELISYRAIDTGIEWRRLSVDPAAQ